jgi:hypothetical protein
LSAHPPSE